MNLLKTFFPLIGFMVFYSGVAHSCESYEQHSIDEIKEFRAMLGQKDADPLDRLFAYEQMVCSDRPTIRSYATKEGLKTIDDPLVRNEIMLRAMMQKTRIDIELGVGKKLTSDDKKFVAEHGGIYSHQVTFKSLTEGCMGLYREDCRTSNSVFISGDKVELNYSGVAGEFRLSPAGELVGTLRARNHQNFTRIPAVIKLF